jgi:hypothetical protein
MNITRLSKDLAKDVFQLYGVVGKQKGVLTKRITSRTKLIEFVSKLKACEIYMGAPYRYVNAYRVSCQLEEIRMAYTINQLARLSEVSTRTR